MARPLKSLLSLAKTDRCAFLLDFLDLAKAADDADALYNAMQIALWNTPDKQIVRVDNKARQLGWSWAAAADAVAAGVLHPNTTSIFVSYNQDEAAEKIVYAKRIIGALHPSVRPKLVDDNKTFLTLDNGSRLISHPCKPPRGKGKPRVYLDEMAFYGGQDADIYRAAVGALGRGGVIRIGSTPRPVGKFRELAEGQPDADGAVKTTRAVGEWPWWFAPHLCHSMAGAALNAAAHTTEERVQMYGTARLVTLYDEYLETGDLGGFQQEYECAFVSATSGLIGWDWIRGAQHDYEIGHVPEGGIVTIGADFARAQDQTALVTIHYNAGYFTLLDIEWMRGAQAPEQAARLVALASKYSPWRIYGDITDGFGRAVIDMVKQSCPFADGIAFTKTAKEEMVAATSAAFYNRRITIPRDQRMLADDIASVRKVQNLSGHTSYESPRNSKGHADSFWALALALMAAPRLDAATFEYRSVERRETDWSNAGSARRVEFDDKGATRGAIDDGSVNSTRTWGDY